jgi:hypothetical protein
VLAWWLEFAMRSGHAVGLSGKTRKSPAIYVSQQMLRVHHDEWLRFAETRRLISQVKSERRPESRRGARRQPRLGALRLGRPVRHA